MEQLYYRRVPLGGVDQCQHSPRQRQHLLPEGDGSRMRTEVCSFRHAHGRATVAAVGSFALLGAEDILVEVALGDQWLEVKDNDFGKEIGDIEPEKEEEFYKYHAQFILRRKKEEVLPQLPPKQRIEVTCSMRPRQRQHYRKFAKEAELILNDIHLSSTNKLAEMSRLKAFASGECVATRRTNGSIKLHPDFSKGGKADALLETTTGRRSGQGRSPSYCRNPVLEVADSIFAYLSERDFNVAKITGSVGAKERGKVIKSFQEGELQVWCLH
jgi:SNF2 family DNA or RNA helicase